MAHVIKGNSARRVGLQAPVDVRYARGQSRVQWLTGWERLRVVRVGRLHLFHKHTVAENLNPIISLQNADDYRLASRLIGVPPTLTVSNFLPGLSINSVLAVMDDRLVLVALVKLFFFYPMRYVY